MTPSFDSASPPNPADGEKERDHRPCVLIVDDVPANLGVLLSCLDGAGYEVLVAASGESALARLEHVRPDILLLDVCMPGIDGYETCWRLKADARWRDVPVLFLTALGDPVDKVRGFAVGAVDFITKPLHTEEVLARVRAHLQIRSLQRALEDKNELLETAMARRLEAEAQLQLSIDRAVLVVDEEGAVEFWTRRARRLLERYFAEHTDPDQLPPALVAWLAANPAGNPWRVERTEGCLEVQLFAPGRPGSCLVLLLDEEVHRANSPAQLLHLGLTSREAEVLYWAAHGKSNAEVAAILHAAVGTIKKHVANILVKIGAETRLIAALQAAEILALGTTNPTKSLLPAAAAHESGGPATASVARHRYRAT